MIFMHIYALFAQNRRCPLTGWRKHAHPPPRKRIPEKRFENFQLSEPSRTLAPRRLHILFFLSLTPVYPFPRCRLSRGPECSRPPIFDSAYIYIYTDQYTQDTYIYTHRLQSVDWPSLPFFFFFFFFFVQGIAKAGSNGWWWQKEKKPRDGSGPFAAWNSLARSFVVAHARVLVWFVISGSSATRTWPKAGISLISFPAVLPTEVAIKIVWKGGRYAYNEYSGVLRFSWSEPRRGIRSWRGACGAEGCAPAVRWSSVVFWNCCEGEGNVMRRKRKRGN